MPTIWQELDELKKRVTDLERQDMVILEESFQVLNSENLEKEMGQAAGNMGLPPGLGF